MQEVYTKEETQSFKVGAYVALAILAIIGYKAFTAQEIEHADNGSYYALDARFGRTDGLLVGDKVRLAGVTVGKVVGAKLDEHFNAIMTIEIKEGINIPDDSSASIVSSGLMGPKYIEIEPGGSEDYLAPGSEFSYTQDAMVIEELLDRIVSIGKANRAPKEQKEIEKMVSKIESLIADGQMMAAKELKKEKQKMEKDLERKQKRMNRRQNSIPQIEDEDAEEVIALWTKIPVNQLKKGEMERLRNLEKELHKRVIGQEEAVKAVSKAVRRSRVGLQDPKRPIGSFLFLGPTGVGKTELSKALADAMFGTENSLIRVDMSEFMEKHTVSKLIGSPPGYVGYDEGGQLSEKVRRNPYSVILFDEVEKAHPDVFNVLLQVLDDGHITDSTGRVIDFKNTIIIMTSNAGAENIVSPKSLGFSSGMTEQQNHEEMKGKVMDEVKRIFKPEFINRIDDIVVFHVLGKEQIAQIVDIMIANVNKRIMEQMKLSIELDDAARQWLVDKGYDSKYGARPLRRTIQNEVEDVLAERILMGKVHAGNKVKITVKDNKLNFTLKRGMNK